MNKIDIDKDRMISGTGWLTHTLAVKVGMCEKDEYCPNEAEKDLQDFLWNLLRFSDYKPIHIGYVTVMLKLNTDTELSEIHAIYEEKDIII